MTPDGPGPDTSRIVRAHCNCTLGTPCSTLRRTPFTHYNCTLDTPEAHSLCRRCRAHYRTTPSEDPAPPLPPPAAVNSGILHNEVCLCARCAVCRGGARGGKQQISQICDSSSWHHLGEGHYEGVGSWGFGDIIIIIFNIIDVITTDVVMKW